MSNSSNPVLPTAKILSESLCAMQLLRTLGFKSDNIYIMLGSQEDPSLVLVVLKEPNKTFAISIGITTEDHKTFVEKWEKAANEWNSTPTEDGMKQFDESDVRKAALQIMQQMLVKGFHFPNANLPKEVSA